MTATVIALVPAARDPRDTELALAALAAALAARGRPCTIALPLPTGDPAVALLSAFAPTVAEPSLPAAVAAAVDAAGPGTVLALGDAAPAALRIVLADAARGLPRPWPLGPGTLPRARLLRGAALILLTGPAEAAGPPLPPGVPVLRAVPALLETGMDWAETRLMLVGRAGALPALARMMAAAGATVAGTAPLDTAGALPRALITRIAAEARARRARLAAPEPDAVRLPPALRREALALPVRLSFADPAPLDAALVAAGLQSQQDT
jgi:tetraacyldisaccharide 4'-kinase